MIMFFLPRSMVLFVADVTSRGHAGALCLVWSIFCVEFLPMPCRPFDCQSPNFSVGQIITFFGFTHPIGSMYAAIYVTWIPSIYPSHVSINIPAPWILHGNVWQTVYFPVVDQTDPGNFRYVFNMIFQRCSSANKMNQDDWWALQGYLHHYYYALPRHMVFVHADMPDHIGAGRPNIIDDTLRALMHGASVPFAHLGNNRVTCSWFLFRNGTRMFFVPIFSWIPYSFGMGFPRFHLLEFPFWFDLSWPDFKSWSNEVLISYETSSPSWDDIKITPTWRGWSQVTMRWNPDLMTPLWKGLFGSSIAPAAGEVSTYCCSHFVLSRDRALLRPRRFYENAVKFVMSPESYFYLPSKWSPARQRRAADFDMRGRVVCQNMMFLWHIFFGEPLELPHRMYDPSLPLFLKTRNIRTAYMDDDGLWTQKDVKKRGFKDVQIQSTTLAWCWSVVWYV